jgi:hypothetical protein
MKQGRFVNQITFFFLIRHRFLLLLSGRTIDLHANFNTEQVNNGKSPGSFLVMDDCILTP